MKSCDEKEILLLRNLKDAGCGAAMTEQFLACEREAKFQGERRLLLRQRRALLQKIHANQKRIDCLDFLLHSVEEKLQSEKGELVK